MDLLTMQVWSPYLAGAGIGVLSWFAFLLSDKPLGCSTSYSRASGMFERLIRGKKVDEMPYYIKTVPEVDWQMMLVAGVVIGAFIASWFSGVFALIWVPTTFAGAFGNDPLLRLIVAIVGGVLMGIGARWAGGCTSGHGISGSLQLAISGWVAVIFFFIGGIVTAMAIFGIPGA